VGDPGDGESVYGRARIAERANVERAQLLEGASNDIYMFAAKTCW
jgi:hypothetical protein